MSEQQKKSIQQRWDNLRPSKVMLFWSCAGTAVATLIVGFSWGGWVTGGTAREMAQDAGDQSRYELASTICADKFMAATNARAQLTELKAIDSSYRQRQFIDDGGWAMMPGQEKASRQATELCAKVLEGTTVDAAPAPGVDGKLEPISAVQ